MAAQSRIVKHCLGSPCLHAAAAREMVSHMKHHVMAITDHKVHSKQQLPLYMSPTVQHRTIEHAQQPK
jgi:hypothetical protein